MPTTTTMTAIGRKMLEICGEIGRTYTIASGTGTTMVVSRLALGALPSSTFENLFALRREAASQPADRERLITGFTASTGTFTVGTMADTTFTNESLDVLNYPPYSLDIAVNWALNYLRREHTITIPVINNRTRYPMGTLMPWERYPNDITRVAFRPSPVLTTNRYLQDWNTYSSAGVLTPPDGFVLSGASATVTRSTTQTYQSPYSAALLRSGADAVLTQTVGILPTGVADDSLQGQVVTAGLMGWASVADRLYVQISDGTTTTVGTAHTGGSTFERLTVTATLGASASNLTVAGAVKTGDTTAYIDQLFVHFGEASDAAWRDEYPETVLDIDDYHFDQAQNVITLPRMGRQGQWLISTRRPYAQWPQAMIQAGTADALITDAPVEAAATVAVWKLWRDLSDSVGGRDRTKFGALADLWALKAQAFAGHHLHERQSSQGGVMPPFAFSPPAMRWGRR